MEIFGVFSLPDWLALFILVITGLYIYFTWHFNYWKSQNVKTIRPVLPFFGSLWTILFETIPESDVKAYQEKEKVWGYFEARNPALMVADLDMIKAITVKDFNNFTNRRRFPVGKSQNISKLFLSVMESDEWRMHRSILSPTFTSGRLRQMTSLMEECCDEMVKQYGLAIEKEKDTIDVKMRFGAYAMDVIATTCFNYKINAQDPADPFCTHAKMLFNQSFALKGLLSVLSPGLFEYLDIPMFPTKCLKFFEKVIHQVVGMRRQENIKRNDFLQLLLDIQSQDLKDKLPAESNHGGQNGDTAHLNSDSSQSDEVKAIPLIKKVLTEDALVAHSMLFLLAGFDTTATATSLVCYHLALNPECQEKLFKEIDESVKEHGKLKHDIIMALQYLDMVLSETLRIHPPGLRLERRCTNDCQLGDITLKKDMIVVIPVYAIHHDEEYYPDPEKFDPERFTPENKAKRNPMTYIPFGFGPRNCIGMRFALSEVKMGVAHFIHNFKVSPSRRTVVPLKIRKGMPLIIPVDGIHLKVEKRR